MLGKPEESFILAFIFLKEYIKAGRRDDNVRSNNKILKYSIGLWHLIESFEV